MAGFLLIFLLSASVASAFCTLGTASGFAVLAGTTVTNAGLTVISGGDVGVSPGTAITGFPPGVVLAPHEVLVTTSNGDRLLAAKSDLEAAMVCYSGMAPTQTLAVDLGGLVLGPGIYEFATTATFTGTLTLDGGGDTNSQFVFNIGTSFTVGASTTVALINGAHASNVMWNVGTSMTVAATTLLSGDFMIGVSLTMASGATSDGRLMILSGGLTLISNTITVSEPVTTTQIAQPTTPPLMTTTTAAPVPTCQLSTAGAFAVLTGTTITNAGATVISGGDVGPGTTITGFPPE